MYSIFALAKKYIHYYFTADNGKGHGVHSPFVFDFIKQVKNDRKQYPWYTDIELIREQLLADTTLIPVRDFGAGSAVIKTNDRAISKIAASSLKPKKFARLFFRIAQYYHPQTMVELGTSFGTSSAYLASGNPNGKLYTLEGAPAIAAIAQQNFRKLALSNIELIEGDFAATFPALLQRLEVIDLAFVDGNHRKIPTLEYFHALLKKSVDHTILIFDDIHWSEEMEAVWEEIKADAAVTLSIDLFFIGIVFLSNRFKVKQHYRIQF
ncbi:MAG: class I SAM-dependent methyltransferase [Chryseobacterium sp.]|nr:MAG: class I SAM-dependent methyltransferase [Chryseobacterium sp.]